MKIWIQCRTPSEAEFFVQAVLEGYFGNPLACQISPLNPNSVDVNFHSYVFDDEKMRMIPFLVGWDYYEDPALEETPEARPPDLRRGVILPMHRCETANEVK